MTIPSSSFRFEDLHVDRYRFPGSSVTIERRTTQFPIAWAVCRFGECWNHVTKEFEYEPQPSERTNAFIIATRFATAEDAFKAFWDHWVSL